MFYVVNMETHAIYTYREGDRITYANEEAARHMASMAQELMGTPHQVLPISSRVVDSLPRDVAPWLKR